MSVASVPSNEKDFILYVENFIKNVVAMLRTSPDLDPHPVIEFVMLFSNELMTRTLGERAITTADIWKHRDATKTYMDRAELITRNMNEMETSKYKGLYEKYKRDVKGVLRFLLEDVKFSAQKPSTSSKPPTIKKASTQTRNPPKKAILKVKTSGPTYSTVVKPIPKVDFIPQVVSDIPKQFEARALTSYDLDDDFSLFDEFDDNDADAVPISGLDGDPDLNGLGNVEKWDIDLAAESNLNMDIEIGTRMDGFSVPELSRSSSDGWDLAQEERY